jgi:hypothetical protein
MRRRTLGLLLVGSTLLLGLVSQLTSSPGYRQLRGSGFTFPLAVTLCIGVWFMWSEGRVGTVIEGKALAMGIVAAISVLLMVAALVIAAMN